MEYYIEYYINGKYEMCSGFESVEKAEKWADEKGFVKSIYPEDEKEYQVYEDMMGSMRKKAMKELNKE